MTEAKKLSVEINLGGKTLLSILNAFEAIGWKRRPGSLEGIKLDTMMIYGDEDSAQFWHLRKGFDSSGRLQMNHKDKLEKIVDSVQRDCPTDGLETVLSSD